MSIEEVPERLQKFLAQRGIGSRREIETWIEEGRVVVNGKRAVLGCKITSQDIVVVNGRTVSGGELKTVSKAKPHKNRIILYNKPIGQICTRSDPEGRPTVFENLPKLTEQRWVAVGRLDINSSGLILFTTDGELANILMHPSANIEREYAVRLLGTVTPAIQRKITSGVVLDDGTKAKFNSVSFVGGSGANTWHNVTLSEGKYREVRRIFETQELKVNRLIRIRFGDIKLPKDLPEGEYLELDYDNIQRKFAK